MSDQSVALSTADALLTLSELRREHEIVITSMGNAREWMLLHAGRTPHPLDFILVPSSMGQATSMGLGMALARPDLRIIVCSGDGSLLMNLGSLVTIGGERPRNLVVLLFDNGVYEVTGAQPTPAAAAGRAGGTEVSYSALARVAGFAEVSEVSDIVYWRSNARELLDREGPTFVHLRVPPVAGGKAPHAPRDGSAGDRGSSFRQAVSSLPSRALFRVRRAVAGDAADVVELISHYVESGALLPRTEAFVVENAADFLVAVEGDRVVGCAHLEDYAPSLAELRSLAVHPERMGVGIGRALAAAIEELARKREYRTLFAVSNDEAFFLRLGYEVRDIPELDRERSAVSRFKGVYAKRLV